MQHRLAKSCGYVQVYAIFKKESGHFRIPAIDGRLNTAGREWANALGLTGVPPKWQSGRYQAVLALENGRWKIKNLTLIEYLND